MSNFQPLTLKPAINSPLMTTDEVATLCRTVPATVRYWRHIGTGPRGFKVGRRVLYDADDVQSWLKGRREADLADAG